MNNTTNLDKSNRQSESPFGDSEGIFSEEGIPVGMSPEEKSVLDSENESKGGKDLAKLVHHIPVLLESVLQVLRPQSGESYIDTTAGLGGHAQLVIDKIGETGQAILIDQDTAAVAALEKRFAGQSNIHVVHSNFAELDWETLPPADMILMDLGVSSMQLDQAERGFSFRSDGPLDMRMNQTGEVCAADIVNGLAETELADVIWKYGEERHSRKLARAIIAARPIKRTGELRTVIHDSIGSGGRIDSATKTFQAIRIAVNRELQVLEETLPKATDRLKPGGRLAIISFHSLEDRIVKNYFRSLTTAEPDPITGHPMSGVLFRNVTKKPIIASTTEIDSNPRARSAKLRAVEKQT